MILLLEIIENWLGANSFSNMEVNEKIQADRSVPDVKGLY